MTKCAPVWRLLLSIFLALAVGGCSQWKRSGVAEEKDPHFLEGKRRESGLDWNGAIQSYERALQSNPNNAAAHFELALLYDKKLNDPATAIYHYQKHFNLRTNTPHADFIKNQVAYCKSELAKTHSYAVINRDVQQHLERLTMANENYRKRIDALEAELARGPRYITNYVTNFVKLPDFNERGPRSLTRSTTIVEAPEDQPEEQAPQVQQRPTPAPATLANRDTTPPRNSNTSTPRNTSTQRSTPRASSSQSQRSTPKPASGVRTVHTVKPGDTLQVIARRYKVSTAALRKANPGLGSGTRSGQKINIPAK